MQFLLNISIESCQVQRIEFIVGSLSETGSPLGHNPEVSGLLVHRLTAQVDHAQTVGRHLLHGLCRGEHRHPLHLGSAARLLEVGQTGGLEQLEVAGEFLCDVMVKLTDLLQMFLRAGVLRPRLIVPHGCTNNSDADQ